MSPYHNDEYYNKANASLLQESALSDRLLEEDHNVYHLRIAYRGTNYHGWQIQEDVPTVQGEVLKRVRTLFREPDLEMHGTSRTDAGVHALDQHASFVVKEENNWTPTHLRDKLNSWLPKDIRILEVRKEPTGFHARFNAIAKSYIYSVNYRSELNPFEIPYLWYFPKPLDVSRMREAADKFVGRHDFGAFSANPNREIATTVRTLFRFEIIHAPPCVYFCVIGDGFLYKMVRSLVGYLIRVGSADAWNPAELHDLFVSGIRPAFVETAPPDGLFLAKVFLKENEWQDYLPDIPPHATVLC